MKDTLLLIDANSLIYRAFHALPPFTSPHGRPSGALYGLASILIKVFKERPFEYGAAAFDTPEPTVRESTYKAYKATRPPVPPALGPQIQEAHLLLDAFGIKTLEIPGWEADDIVATLAHRFAKEKNLQIIALSGDLDLLQIVRNNKIVVEMPKKGISNTVIYNEEAVEERFGIRPGQLTDFKGLTGDTSDNVPGVPGVGPKTASDLVKRYGTLEKLYKEADEIGMPNEKLRQRLRLHKDQALLSKELVTLNYDLPLGVSLSDLAITRSLTHKEIVDYLSSWGFQSLAKRVAHAPGSSADEAVRDAAGENSKK